MDRADRRRRAPSRLLAGALLVVALALASFATPVAGAHLSVDERMELARSMRKRAGGDPAATTLDTGALHAEARKIAEARAGANRERDAREAAAARREPPRHAKPAMKPSPTPDSYQSSKKDPEEANTSRRASRSSSSSSTRRATSAKMGAASSSSSSSSSSASSPRPPSMTLAQAHAAIDEVTAVVRVPANAARIAAIKKQVDADPDNAMMAMFSFMPLANELMGPAMKKYGYADQENGGGLMPFLNALQEDRGDDALRDKARTLRKLVVPESMLPMVEAMYGGGGGGGGGPEGASCEG